MMMHTWFQTHREEKDMAAIAKVREGEVTE